MASHDLRSEALSAASERRVALKDAVSRVERAASSPSGMPSWRSYVVGELTVLEEALKQHIVEVEGSEGLLAELASDAPRLIHKINVVRDEHPVLEQKVAATIAGFDTTTDAEVLRASILETLSAVVRHRQRGADLVFEGYNVDIGGG